MKNRLILIDTLRAIAIILMVSFHSYISENLFYFGKDRNYYDTHSGNLAIIGEVSRTIFLILVGVSYMLSLNNAIKNGNKNKFIKSQFKRGIIILLCSFLVSIITKMALPNQYILYGILHFIGTIIILLTTVLSLFNKSFFNKKSLESNNKTYCSIVINFIAIILYLNFLGIFNITKNNESTFFNYMLGSNPYYHANTIDYFPINKNLYKVAFGIFLGQLIVSGYKIKNTPVNNFMDNLVDFEQNIKKNYYMKYILNFLELLGKNSLFIYMFHIPILYFYSNRYILYSTK